MEENKEGQIYAITRAENHYFSNTERIRLVSSEGVGDIYRCLCHNNAGGVVMSPRWLCNKTSYMHTPNSRNTYGNLEGEKRGGSWRLTPRKSGSQLRSALEYLNYSLSRIPKTGFRNGVMKWVDLSDAKTGQMTMYLLLHVANWLYSLPARDKLFEDGSRHRSRRKSGH